jgi:endo-1,4-beta-mannosidase
MSDDPVRHHLAAAFACELAGGFGRPVVLEEFGLTGDFAADDHAAHYYRQVLYSTLIAGATGWLAWNNTDYDDLADQDPYRHHPFEMHFGLTDHRGRPKAALHELAKFSTLIGALPVNLADRVRDDQVRVVVPEHFERALPFFGDTASAEADRTDIRDTLAQCYVAAREADLTPRFERERDGITEGGRLYLLPSAKVITAPGARELRRLAQAGACVYYSYFPGGTGTQRGPWVPWIDEFFGVRQRLSYGLNEPVTGETVTFRFTADFGPIPAGHRLEFPVGGNAHVRGLLPVEPAGARVVAVDDRDRPALLVNETGSGRAVLCTYPVEHMAARTPWANPEPTWALYDALAEVAGADRPLRCTGPAVSCATMRFGPVGSGGRDLAIVSNLSARESQADPFGKIRSVLVDAITGTPWEATAMVLGPYEVRAAILEEGNSD